MTIKGIVIALALFSCSSLLYAQEALIVKDTKKQRNRVFKPGNTFLFLSSSDSIFHKGKIQEIGVSSVTLRVVDEKEPTYLTIPLKDFQVIRKATKAQYISYAIGALFMINGTYFILEGPNVGASHWAGRGIGVISFVLGVIPFTRTPKTYELGDRYVLETKNVEKPSQE